MELHVVFEITGLNKGFVTIFTCVLGSLSRPPIQPRSRIEHVSAPAGGMEEVLSVSGFMLVALDPGAELAWTTPTFESRDPWQ